MNRTRIGAALTLSFSLAVASTASADVRTEDKTLVRFEGALGRVMNFFGGKAAKEGVVSTVAVKGDRKATMSDETGQIIDLAEENIRVALGQPVHHPNQAQGWGISRTHIGASR